MCIIKDRKDAARKQRLPSLYEFAFFAPLNRHFHARRPKLKKYSIKGRFFKATATRSFLVVVYVAVYGESSIDSSTGMDAKLILIYLILTAD